MKTIVFSILTEIPEYPDYISKKELLKNYSLGVLQDFLKHNKKKIHTFRNKEGLWISRKFSINKLYSIVKFKKFVLEKLETIKYFNLKREIKEFLRNENKIFDKNLVSVMAQQTQNFVSELIKKKKIVKYSKFTYLVS